MHTYKVSNYGIFIPISQIKQDTLDDLKTLKEYGEIMTFNRDVEDVEIYSLTDVGDIDWDSPWEIDWDSPWDNDFDAILFIANNKPKLYSSAYTEPNDLIKEIKDKYGKYFPDDYDFEESIVWAKYITYY